MKKPKAGILRQFLFQQNGYLKVILTINITSPVSEIFKICNPHRKAINPIESFTVIWISLVNFERIRLKLTDHKSISKRFECVKVYATLAVSNSRKTFARESTHGAHVLIFCWLYKHAITTRRKDNLFQFRYDSTFR